MRRGGGLGGSVEIVAERRAERGLVALGDGDLLQHRRPKPAGTRLQQLFERADFGLQPLSASLGGLERRPRGGLGFTRRFMGVFALSRGEIGRLRVFVGDLQRFFEPRQFLRAAPSLAISANSVSTRVSSASKRAWRRFSSATAASSASRRAFDRGETLLRAPKLRLGRVQRRLDPLNRLAGLALAFLRLRVGPEKFAALFLQTLRHLGRVLDQRPLALEIAGELLDMAGHSWMRSPARFSSPSSVSRATISRCSAAPAPPPSRAAAAAHARRSPARAPPRLFQRAPRDRARRAPVCARRPPLPAAARD